MVGIKTIILLRCKVCVFYSPSHIAQQDDQNITRKKNVDAPTSNIIFIDSIYIISDSKNCNNVRNDLKIIKIVQSNFQSGG